MSSPNPTSPTTHREYQARGGIRGARVQLQGRANRDAGAEPRPRTRGCGCVLLLWMKCPRGSSHDTGAVPGPAVPRLGGVPFWRREGPCAPSADPGARGSAPCARPWSAGCAWRGLKAPPPRVCSLFLCVLVGKCLWQELSPKNTYRTYN